VPELIEVEAYRRVAEQVLGDRVAAVEAPDAWYLKSGATAEALAEVAVGARLVAARRRGKLLMVDTDRGVVLGLRFGMTGRLLLERASGGPATVLDEVGSLLYAPAEVRAEHRRLEVQTEAGDRLVVVDPRRLGGVELDPDEATLGVDAAGLGAAALAEVLDGSGAGLKALLMDQRRVAGLGNLLTDEVLWRARLAPRTPAGSLGPGERTRLLAAIRETLTTLTARGGSHTGDLQVARAPGATCPRCGGPLRRDTVAGRTTYWCPAEQR
jgi:formamidopyrimidine-DNA glycosylase